jgi:hypothetical protein
MLKVLVNKRGKGEELKWDAMSLEELGNLASTPALFGGARTFRLVGAFADEARGDELLDTAEMFIESPHTFIFEEEKLLKGPTTILEKAGAKIEIEKKSASADVSARPTGFDPFGLTFALGSRDRKKLWLGLTQSLSAGEKPEAIAGLLAWKARQMKDANLSRELVCMYHDSHRGAGDLALLLERFALTL